MSFVSSTTPNSPVAPATPVNPREGGGVQGFIGDVLRGSGAGYVAAGNASALQVDKAMIHPFELVATATGLLKEKTAGIKVLNKVTSLVNTIGGFALLIGTANVSTTMKASGETAFDITTRLADLVDGRDTATGWSLGWGVRTDEETGEPEMTQSGLGAALLSVTE